MCEGKMGQNPDYGLISLSAQSGPQLMMAFQGTWLEGCMAQIIVATGFIAKNPQGQVTTLKRNGSDYSATIVGALARSSHITIWTDVDGVYSADPRKVSSPPALFRFLVTFFLRPNCPGP